VAFCKGSLAFGVASVRSLKCNTKAKIPIAISFLLAGTIKDAHKIDATLPFAKSLEV